VERRLKVRDESAQRAFEERIAQRAAEIVEDELHDRIARAIGRTFLRSFVSFGWKAAVAIALYEAGKGALIKYVF
jgi:hypothetical protein